MEYRHNVRPLVEGYLQFVSHCARYAEELLAQALDRDVRTRAVRKIEVVRDAPALD